jgi:bacterioferritin-associated ferredoxin
MHDDDHVCLCYHVSLRKLRAFIKREKPPVASQLSECLGAGTGCGWCVPFLEDLHRQWKNGDEPDLPVSPRQYASARETYRESGRRARPDVAGTEDR